MVVKFSIYLNRRVFVMKNKKNNIYPCKPGFTIEKWGLMGSKLHMRVFVMKTVMK